MSHYPNPYEFVPFEATGPVRPKVARTQDGSTSGLTGKIVCTLTTLTPMFVGAIQAQTTNNPAQYIAAELNGRPMIPATALKGMVRSVIEAASNSCLGVLSDGPGAYRGIPQSPTDLVGDYAPCKDIDALCPTCALLGMVEEKAGAGQKGKALGGRVFFSDAIPIAEAPSSAPPEVISVRLPARRNQQHVIVPLGNPKPAHKEFYFRPEMLDDLERIVIENKVGILGRKFYYRTTRWQKTIKLATEWYHGALGNSYREIQLNAVNQGIEFSFEVYFTNLSQAELDLLVYGIILEDRMCHHIGYGKPFGLGSVRIAITSLVTEAKDDGVKGAARYLVYKPQDEATAWQPYNYQGYADRVWKRTTQPERVKLNTRAERSRGFLKFILAWPRPHIFQYPRRVFQGHPMHPLNQFVNEDGDNIPLSDYRQKADWMSEKLFEKSQTKG